MRHFEALHLVTYKDLLHYGLLSDHTKKREGV